MKTSLHVPLRYLLPLSLVLAILLVLLLRPQDKRRRELEIERTARSRMEQITAQMARAEGVTEELKAADQMKWVGLMNNIRQTAEEAVLTELIYN